jgi:putative Mg2+ transporter-C (MgtC) family protein
MAGTRTNALVAAGASAFVMSGLLLDGDPSARGRIASYVVSGVGFLGAGVIFKDGTNVRGLNTAATIWCSAAMGVLCGFGRPHFALLLALAVLLTNTVLRPLAYRLHPALPAVEAGEVLYAIVLTCRNSDETHLRAHFMTTIAQEAAVLHGIHSEDMEGSDGKRLRAEVVTIGKQNALIEKIAMRLAIEDCVTSLSWSVVPGSME